MLTALIAGTFIAQIEQSPRAKSTLENGCHVYVERLATPGRASVALAVSTAGRTYNPAEHGWVHLVEHLVARGRSRDLDKRLESQGMMLVASTTRDASIYQISGRPEQMPFAIQCLRELAEPLVVTQEDIAKEIGILREEYMLRSSLDFLGEQAWVGVMGPSGGGPFGSLEAMAAATPENVSTTHQSLFSGGSAGVTVAGDIEVSSTLVRLTEVFGTLRASQPGGPPAREPVSEIGAEDGGQRTGVVRGVVIQGIDDVRGAAALMAAVGFGVELRGVQPLYTASTWPGLVMATSASPQGLDRLDQFQEEDLAAFYPTARRAVLAMVDDWLRDPVKFASLMAVLTRQNPSINSERVREWFLVVRQNDFVTAAQRFRREGSYTVTGGAL